ncbi:hypothetical protein QU487_13410 [Crenobacter sp. SG2305]|uniref:hypothetical protein n=1 Tax=Crenobacter oryzisoli TaxID=3056844 RepID=UPI0025AB1210|nr:hypothetical protein [Crenobacter sp. SG2305]MDN0083745.1 hypothetical protein [Crenobacter sp. SG2305]
MKIASSIRKHDGTHAFESVIHQDRMTWALFQSIHPGRQATSEEIALAKIRAVPDGFSVWRCDNGELFAVRDE